MIERRLNDQSRWPKENIVSTCLRIAAGSCVLSAGLVVASAGGAVAAADPDSDSSPTPSQVQSANEIPSPPGGTVENPADGFFRSVQATFEGMNAALGSLGSKGQFPGFNPATRPPIMVIGGTPTAHGSTSTEETAPAAPGTGEDPSDDVAPSGADPAEPESDATIDDGLAVTSSKSNSIPATAPSTVPSAAALDAAAPAAKDSKNTPTVTTHVTGASVGLSPLTTMTWWGPVTKAFATAVTSVMSVPAVVFALPTSATPIEDLIASMENVLSSVAYAGISLTRVPSDFVSSLGITETTAPTIGGAAGHRIWSPRALNAPVSAVAAPDLSQLIMPVAGPGDAPVSDAVTLSAWSSKLAPQAASRGMSTSVVPFLNPAGGDSSDTLTTVEHVIGAVVATVSLTALAAVALPGILGLLGTCAAGIRIGYRQAKTGSELPATAIARFVGSGPVGVVRSSSQVSLRPRVVRSGSRPVRSVRLLDRAV